MNTMNLTIRGMHCGSCKRLIEDVCLDIPGVTSCQVDPQTGETVIEHDGTVPVDRVKSEIETLGDYHVNV